MSAPLGELYVEIKAKQEKLEKDLRKLEGKAGREGAKAGKAFSKKFTGKIKAIGAAIAGAFVVKKVFDVGRAAVKTAMDFEMLRSRLVALKGSQDAANKTFEIYKKLAATTPFDLKGLTEAGAAMEAFGIDSEKHLKTTADLAAFMGISAQEAASAWGRAWAGGAGASDIFRERGVLNLIKMKSGIEDLTKLTKDEFRNTMISVFTEVGGGIAGATDILSKTAVGGISNLQDALDALADATFKRTLPGINKLARGVAAFVEKITPVETELEKVTKKSVEQGREFDVLTSRYIRLREQENLTKEQKKLLGETIDSLNSKYGEYLGNIDLERAAFEDVKDAIKSAKDELIAKAKQLAVYATQKDLFDKIVSKQEEIMKLERQRDETAQNINIAEEANVGLMESLVSKNVGLVKLAYDRLTANKQVEGSEETINAAVAEREKLEKELNAIIEEHGDKLSVVETTTESIATNTKLTADEMKAAKKAAEEMANFQTFLLKADRDRLITFKKLLDSKQDLVSMSSEAKAHTADLGKEWLSVQQKIKDADYNLNAGLVNGLTDAILGAKSLASALGEVGKRLADMAIGNALQFGLSSIIPGGGLLSKLFGFADGGQISNIGGRPVVKAAGGFDGIVPPGFPNDSFPIMVQSGERVQVTPAGETSNSNYNISLNVRALDPIGFERWAKTDGRRAFDNLFRDMTDRGRG